MAAPDSQPVPGVSGASFIDVKPIAEAISEVIELCGIAVIVLGALFATLVFLYRLYQEQAVDTVYHHYRGQLGRGILLGLEFLVAADIIGTVSVDPTFENLGALGVIVLIRTFLSFSLEVEITGRLPWQSDQ